jgi:hypothetical protein
MAPQRQHLSASISAVDLGVRLMRSPALNAITASPSGNSKSRAATTRYLIKVAIASWLAKADQQRQLARLPKVVGRQRPPALIRLSVTFSP